MAHLAYLGVLAFCLVGTGWLEVVLGVRVWRRWRRLLATLAPVVVVFVVWDLYAIARQHWHFDPAQTTGVTLPGRLPIEELLFFVVVPICSVLTLEAVRTVRRWPTGDESTTFERRPLLPLPRRRRPRPGATPEAATPERTP
ncbi:MAG: lycopene cyclase domain-containing protein [Actinomycetes bacterium]